MITIEIEAVDRTSDVEQESLIFEAGSLSKEPSTLTFTMKGSKTMPSMGDAVTLTEDGTTIFSGTLVERRQSLMGSLIKGYTFVCMDGVYELNRQLVNKSYNDQTAVAIVTDVLSTFTTGFTLDAPADSPTIKTARFNYLSPSRVLQKIANQIGWDWYVDPSNVVHFFPPEYIPSPFSISDTNGNMISGSLRLDSNLVELRNVVYVRGGEYTSAIVEGEAVDKYEANGVDDTFPLVYRYENVEVTKNGDDQDVGVDYIDSLLGSQLSTGTTTSTSSDKLVDSGATFQTDGVQAGDQIYNSTDDTYALVTAVDSETQLSLNKDIMTSGEAYVVTQVSNDCLYNFQEKLVRFPEGALADGDIVRVFGDALIPLIVQAEDQDSIDTYGRKEYLELNRNINSIEEAEDAALALIEQWREGAREGLFRTRQTGLCVGQSIDIASTQLGIDDRYKINKIRGFMNGYDQFEYEVEFIKSGQTTLVDILIGLIGSEKDNIEISADEVVQKFRNLDDAFTMVDEITEQTGVTGPYHWSPVTTGTAFNWNFGTWS